VIARLGVVGVAKRGPRWILLRSRRPYPAEKVLRCRRVQRRALRSVQSFGGSRPLCGPRRCKEFASTLVVAAAAASS
jgi:hypothetical protein